MNNIQGQYMMQNQYNMNAMYYQQAMYNNYMMNQQNQYNNNGMIAPQTQPNNTIKEVSITDCFDYDRKENRMSGENSFFCNVCGGLNEAIMKTNLITGPEVLIIILNRGKGIEFDVKINFFENLDLSNYIEKKETGCSYQLIGVITHLGESSMSGHFIAYCRDPINKKSWYKYNDAIVSDVSDFKKEVIDFAMPYLLFYQKIKTQ
jgi:ubiquitin C-terminal hydrolase